MAFGNGMSFIMPLNGCEINVRINLVPRAVFINSPGTGHEVLNSDWPIKTHNPRPKILESRQINIANTNFRAFRQSNKRRIIIARKIAFQEQLMLLKKYT